MIARTLGQHAEPTTFATVTTRWTRALGDAARAVSSVALHAALGGPAGDGDSFTSPEVAERFADRLGLSWAPPRHSVRPLTASIAGAWGVAAACLAKVALDVVLLAQSDIGELSELAEGAGGSSSMPHKHNPIAAVSARAAAMQAPGLVSTLLHAAGGHEYERAAGAWHAEWPALNQLLRATGSAAEWLYVSLQRVVVHPERMAENLARAQERRDG
jgi:3-carboxy-cis,cis-muconate cycloisomerase